MEDTKFTEERQAGPVLTGDEQKRHICQAIRFFHLQGEVFEIRALGPKTPKSKYWEGYCGGNKGIVTGYFNDSVRAVKAIANLDSVGFQGIYLTINPVNPDLLGRADNRLRAAKEGELTSDADILRLRRLLIDADPIRPAGISSTDAEHQAALTLCERINADLSAEGWPEPLYGDSGNGGHLVYAVALENGADGKASIKNVLAGFLKRYANHVIVIDGKEHPCVRLNDVNVNIDLSVFNSSRVSKVYGTFSRKGDSLLDRPHRQAHILRAPENPQAVSTEALDTFLASIPKDEPTQSPKPPKAERSIRSDRGQKYADQAIGNARQMIEQSADGEKHAILLKASELLGGYVGGGIITEAEAREVLQAAIDGKANIADKEAAYKTIEKGLKHGQGRPITFEDKEQERCRESE